MLPGDVMVDLEDPAAVRTLLKKLWCHGQVVAPFQGACYGAWAASDDAAISAGFRALLWVAAAKFPLWACVSWKALHSRYGRRSFAVLALFGCAIVALDLLIAATAWRTPGELQQGWTLLAFIATCLHVVETTAFLAATANFRWALREPELDLRAPVATPGSPA